MDFADATSSSTRDYRYILAAESLVLDIVKSRCAPSQKTDSSRTIVGASTPPKSLTTITLSEQQEQLRISKELVYLAGLADCCVDQEKRALNLHDLFKRLHRTLYNGGKADKDKRDLWWSPTLLPNNPAHRRLIVNDVEERVLELTRLASTTAAQLYQASQLAKDSVTTLKKQRSLGRRARTATSSERCAKDLRDDEDSGDDDEEDDQSEALLKSIVLKNKASPRRTDDDENARPVVAHAINSTTTGDDSDKGNDNATTVNWSKVEKRKSSSLRNVETVTAMPKATNRLEKSQSESEGNVEAKTSIKQPAAASTMASERTANAGGTRTSNRSSAIQAKAIPVDVPALANNAWSEALDCDPLATSVEVEGHDSMDPDPKQGRDSSSLNGQMATTTTATQTAPSVQLAGTSDLEQQVTMLQSNLQLLQLQLASRDQQLVHERQVAAQTLQAEKDAASEQILALQLRLYISETRLKTYEDALTQHITSVTENIAGGRPTLLAAASPTTGERDTATTKASTPLYSRGGGGAESTSPRPTLSLEQSLC